MEQARLSRRAQIHEEAIQPKALPGITQHGQAAVIQSAVELEVLRRHKGLAAQALRDEVAEFLGQAGDIGNGAGPRPLRRPEGFPHPMGKLSFSGPFGLSDLHEHGLHYKRSQNLYARQI